MARSLQCAYGRMAYFEHFQNSWERAIFLPMQPQRIPIRGPCTRVFLGAGRGSTTSPGRRLMTKVRLIPSSPGMVHPSAMNYQ